jgi:hypothetical protein
VAVFRSAIPVLMPADFARVPPTVAGWRMTGGHFMWIGENGRGSGKQTPVGRGYRAHVAVFRSAMPFNTSRTMRLAR